MLSVDIFCRVIDNYGDIGVCWRLAQHLQPYAQVRLFVDQLTAFAHIEPLVHSNLPSQQLQHIHILPWEAAHCSTLTPAKLVIESFGCDLPPAYVQRMPASTQLWLNLDYLSAEPWVESLHLLPSPQANGVPKYFFYPGFTAQTGGLIPPFSTPSVDPDFWHSLQHKPPTTERVAFVFPYAHAPLDALYQALSQSKQSWTVLLAATAPTPTARQCALLPIYQLPFISQQQFDQLLDYADLNLIRGEDSFVRAIWAQRPFIWQPYVQSDDLHLEKLEAWLQSTPFTACITQLMQTWNTGSVQPAQLIHALNQWEQWQCQCQHYAHQLQQHPPLITQLLAFYSQIVQKTVK